MGDFTRLEVWSVAHELACRVYVACEGLAQARHFAIADQLRRAAISIPTNITEGCGRNSDAGLRQFAGIARGSAAEVEYLCHLTAALRLLDEPTAQQFGAEAKRIQKMLHALTRQLSPKPPPPARRQ